RRHDELKGRLHLRAIRVGGEELTRGYDRPHDLANVAVRVDEPLRGAIDERGRRRVGDESPHQLRRDEARGRGMPRKNVEHLFAVGFSAAGLNPMAEDDLFTVVVQPRLEAESAALPRLLDRPS